MATVSELAEHVTRSCSLTSQNATEPALVLRWLNDGYILGVMEAGLKQSAIANTPSSGSTSILASAYTPASSVTQGVARVRGVSKSSSSGLGYRLERVSINELEELRNASVSASGYGSRVYHVRPNGDIELFPATSGEGYVIEVDLLPLVLVSSGAGSGQETSPSSLPARFHYEFLAAYACSRAMEYRGKPSSYWASQYKSALVSMIDFVNMQGGIMGADSGVRRARFSIPRYPDQV